MRLIDRELGFAEEYGYNTLRVFLQFQVWRQDKKGFLQKLDTFLQLCARHNLFCVPVLCDDCAFSGLEPYPGRQHSPQPLVHNSGWTPSPGTGYADDLNKYRELRDYVFSVVGACRTDDRILFWDLYNEPGNSDRGSKSLFLLEELFSWAREAGAEQPLTCDLWAMENGAAVSDAYFNDARALELSDIITFHQYGNIENLERLLCELEKLGYPIICTEWMARVFFDSFITTHLPVFERHDAGCVHWGLVNGKTQTHVPWNWDKSKGEPPVWFHDVLRPDGSPYDPDEMSLIQSYAKRCMRKEG